MQYWKRADIGNFQVYAKELMDYYASSPQNFVNMKNSNNFWTPVKHEYLADFLYRCPELAKGISIYGDVNEVAILTLYTDSSTLHIDHVSGRNEFVQARLNLPILNCKGSITSFYEMDDSIYAKGILNSGKTRYWPAPLRSKLIPVDSVEVTEPTILRTSVPHTVFCTACGFPRITLTISFKEDLVKYLL